MRSRIRPIAAVIRLSTYKRYLRRSSEAVSHTP
jgi:hypothetical protein